MINNKAEKARALPSPQRFLLILGTSVVRASKAVTNSRNTTVIQMAAKRTYLDCFYDCILFWQQNTEISDY